MTKMLCSNTVAEVQHDLEMSRAPAPEIDEMEAYKYHCEAYGEPDPVPPVSLEGQAHREDEIRERAKEVDKVLLRMFNRRSKV